MMKNITILFLVLVFLLANCQDKKHENIKSNSTLVANLDLNNSFFDKKGIDFKKYTYKNVYIEDISIDKFLNKDFRSRFFKDLKNRKNDDDFKISFFVKLLIIRIEQLKDTDSFFLLIETSKDVDLSSDGIELFRDYLIEIFLEDPKFFIQQSTKYSDSEMIKYILAETKDFFVGKDFFELNSGYINLKKGMLLLNPEVEKEFSDNKLISKLKTLPKNKCIFSPSLYSDWKNKTIYFTDISSIFGKELISKLNTEEFVFFKINILPELNKYSIQEDENYSDNQVSVSLDNAEMNTFFNLKDRKPVYYVHDLDGYTNLRSNKNASSEILQKVKSGEGVEVLNNSGDWWQVKTKSGEVGFIHKSRIRSSENSVSVLKIYDRADFNSFSQEITTKNEIEFIYKVSGWDFIKVDGRVGYLPPQEQIANAETLKSTKHSFLVDDEPFPEKKKGFWDRLFG